MKTTTQSCSMLIGTLFLFIPSISAQTIYPDGYEEPLSDAMLFIENDGQLLSENQSLADDIQYFTWGAPGTMYFTTSKYYISAAVRGTSDDDPVSIHRLDFSFANEGGMVEPRLLAPTEIDFKYYQHNGTFDDVNTGRRLAYENVFNDVDVHFYSNEIGAKMSVVFENGANPDVFQLNVSGYDQIIEIQDYLVVHQAGYSYVIPDGFAYEVDEAGNIIPLSWRPHYTHDGNGGLTFSDLGEWNTENTLVFQFGSQEPSRDGNPAYLDWCTLFGGGNSETRVIDLHTDVTGNLYAGGITRSPNFPASNTAFQSTIASTTERDFFLASFSPNHSLTWATFIGGSQAEGDEESFRFGLNSSNNIVAVSYTLSIDFPLFDAGNNAYFDQINDCQGGLNSCSDGVMMEFTSAGAIVHSTFFGEINNAERLRSIVINDNDDYYVVGWGNYPYTDPGGGAYHVTNGSGLVAKFTANRELEWSTSLSTSGGGIFIQDCTLDNNGKLIITGFTGDHSNFPIQALAGAYDQPISNGGSWEGFVTQFDTDHSLEWSTYIGGTDVDQPFSLDVSSTNELIIGGHTQSNTSFPVKTPSPAAFLQNTYGGTGTNTVIYPGDGFFARFSGGRALTHCSYVGDDSSDEVRDIIFQQDFVLATGITASANNFPFPSTSPANMYVETDHQDGNDINSDGYVMALPEEDQSLYWTTYLGSDGNGQPFSPDQLSVLEPYGADRLYVGGAMISHAGVPLQNPGNNAWFQSSTNAFPEGLICLFDISETPVHVEELEQSPFTVYPNPVGEFLTLTAESNEPFNVAIYDLQGREVIVKQVYIGSMDVSMLTNGSYIMQIEQDGQIHTQKIIKQ